MKQILQSLKELNSEPARKLPRNDNKTEVDEITLEEIYLSSFFPQSSLGVLNSDSWR